MADVCVKDGVEESRAYRFPKLRFFLVSTDQGGGAWRDQTGITWSWFGSFNWPVSGLGLFWREGIGNGNARPDAQLFVSDFVRNKNPLLTNAN